MTRPVTAPGRLVAGRYRLQSQIGGGGMGTVWLARDELLVRKTGWTADELAAQYTEAIGAGYLAWLWRAHDLGSADRRRQLLATGRLP